MIFPFLNNNKEPNFHGIYKRKHKKKQIDCLFIFAKGISTNIYNTQTVQFVKEIYFFVIYLFVVKTIKLLPSCLFGGF